MVDNFAGRKKQALSIQKQKMEALARFTSGISHDFNNLLTCIQGFSKLAVKQVKRDGRLRDDISQIYSAAERAGALTRQLLFFSRKQPIKSRDFRINKTIANLLNIFKWLAGENITIRTDLPGNIWPIFGDEVKIEQIITVMVLNSKDAMPRGGDIIIKTENVLVDRNYVENFPGARAGKYVRITLSDQGTGMGEETLGHIFEPYFTTKEMGKGAGLGLFVAYGVVKQHEGWIDFDSKPGKGTTFQIYLPAVSASARRKSETSILLQDHYGNGERVLLIEDEEAVREFVTQALSMYRYEVFGAETAKEALKLFKREKGDFRLVLSDISLNDPGALGPVQRFLKEKPGLKVILTSGCATKVSDIRKITGKGYSFLQKPYSVEDLLQCVKEALLND